MLLQRVSSQRLSVIADSTAAYFSGAPGYGNAMWPHWRTEAIGLARICS